MAKKKKGYYQTLAFALFVMGIVFIVLRDTIADMPSTAIGVGIFAFVASIIAYLISR